MFRPNRNRFGASLVLLGLVLTLCLCTYHNTHFHPPYGYHHKFRQPHSTDIIHFHLKLTCFYCTGSIPVTAQLPLVAKVAGLYPMSTTTVATGPQRAAMARLAVEFIREDPTFNSTIDFQVRFDDDRTSPCYPPKIVLHAAVSNAGRLAEVTFFVIFFFYA